MILTGSEIEAMRNAGQIVVEPYDSQGNPPLLQGQQK